MTATATKPITELLTRTRAKADQRSAADAEAYTKLVRAAAEGKELDPDKVLKELERLGRDVDDFQADVESLAERMLLRSLVAGVTALSRERFEVEEAIRAADREYAAAIAAAEEKVNTVLQPLQSKHAALSAQISTGNEAEQKLRTTCPQDRVDNVHAVTRAHADQQRRLEKLILTVEEMKGRLAAAKRTVDATELEATTAARAIGGDPYAHHAVMKHGPADIQRAKDTKKWHSDAVAMLERLQAAIVDAEAREIPEARSELKRLAAEVQAANDAMLAP